MTADDLSPDEVGRGAAAATARAQLWAAGAWLALLVAFQTFLGEIASALTPFLAAPLWLLILAIGALIAAAGLWFAWQVRQHWRRAAMTAAAFPLAYLLYPPATSAALYLRFLIERPGYDRMVDEISRDPATRTETWRRRHAERVRVDDGPPLRIAFVTWEGIPDPWDGVVHDPSHALGRLDDSPRLRLFDSRIVRCSHLSGAYYRCGFS